MEQLAKASKTVKLIQSQANLNEQTRQAMMSSQQETILLLQMQLNTTNDQLNAKHELLNAYEEQLKEHTQSLKELEEQKRIVENLVAQLTNQVEVLHVQDQATKQTLQSLRQQTEDSLHTIHTENEHLAKLHSRAEIDQGCKDQEIQKL